MSIIELDRILYDFVESVREDGVTDGTLHLPGPGHPLDEVSISLARFQSYRARTRAALLEELYDIAVGGKRLHFAVDDIIMKIFVE